MPRTIYKRLTFYALPLPLALTLALTGCGLKGDDGALEQIVEQTYKVDPTVSLSLTNTDGSIYVYGADIGEIHVRAVKKAYSAARLNKIDIKVSAQPSAVSIETNYPPRKKWGLSDRSGTVDYTVIVPQTCAISKLQLENGELLVEGMRGLDIDAHLGNGRLFAHNCFASMNLTTTSGAIDVYYDWWEDHQFSASAEIVNGSIRAFIPSAASFHLIAETEGGHIANDFAEKEQRHAGGVRKIDNVIGAKPEAVIRLRAKTGNIRIGEVSY